MNKKANPVILIASVLSVIYIFFAVHPLSKEIHFQSKWTSSCLKPSLTPEEIKSQDASLLIPFKLGQSAGYFTEDGKIHSVFTFPYKAAISQSQYAIFGTGDSSISVYSNLGKKLYSINSNGFPFFQKNRNFLMLPGGQSFAYLDEEGKEKWTFENYAPITAFSSSENAVAAGYADGSIYIFDSDGNISQKFIPGGSQYPIILGTAVSDDGLYTAAVSGQKDQRFVFAKKDKSLTTVLYHEYLENETNRQVLLQFSQDTKRCYYAHKDCLGILNIEKLQSVHIPIKGNILSICETKNQNTTFVLSKLDDRYYVTAIQKFTKLSGNFSFKADNAFITVKDDSLFIGKNSSISKIDILHK